MKKRSREINVFSISALDLFASALGAFILISIVLMPYFLNVEPDEIDRLRRALAEANQQLQKSRAETARAQQQAARLQRQVSRLLKAPKYQFPDLDIVIALDTTGSMGKEVASLKNDIVGLTRVLQRLTPSLGFGIVDYKDRCNPATMLKQFPLRRITPSTLRELVAFTRTMKAGGAGCRHGAEEALAAALEAAIASNWRRESKARVIVIVTDNPPYKDKEAVALNDARGAAARSPPVKISTVFRKTGYSKRNTEGYLRRLAEAGKGNFVPSGSTFWASILLALSV